MNVVEGQLDLAGATAQTVAERREEWFDHGLNLISRWTPGNLVSADKLRQLAPAWADACPSSSLYGALFRRAAAEGLIAFEGFRDSYTPSRRGGVQREWRRAGR